MRVIKIKVVCFLIGILSIQSAGAQSNAPALPPTSINGTMDIQFKTLTGAAKADLYTLNLGVCNSALFNGTLNANTSSVAYNIDCDLINPKNPSQTLNIGKISGTVPIDLQNRYHFADGDVTCSILAHGRAAAFDSKFSGAVFGKPPKPVQSWYMRLKHQAVQLQEAVTFNRKVNGKVLSVTLHNYDKMEMQSHVLCAGPTQNYPEATVDGMLYYDYEPRNSWFLRDIRVRYTDGGVEHSDILSGTIHWVKDKDYDHNGVSHYEFDIHFNEPTVSENAAFDATQDDSAFFETDSSISSLTGNMNYVDTFGGSKGDMVVASKVQFNLIGNRITKQQAMYTAKFLMFTCVVPFNGP